MKKGNGKTVFVGVSGGVDSSVTALLLKEACYTVIGVFIRTWTPDFIECTWRDERRDAMRVCAKLDIPFLECNAEEAYKKGVADYMIEEYKKGNTPNPDVMCNREVKFGVFWEFAKARGADFIATGHYAQVCQSINSFGEATGGGVPFQASARNGVKELREKLCIRLLLKSKDQKKDQSYFLWTLTQNDLSHILFPIGHLEKSQVRLIAEKAGLPTATKKDSQGVCFLGPLDMKDFLSHYIEPKQGDVLDENGKVIGHHNGAVFFTLGERHGFAIIKHSSVDVPLYVIGKDIEKNTVTVSPHYGGMQTTKNMTYELVQTNWILEVPIDQKEYTAQIRYHGELHICTIEKISETKARIIFSDPILISKGQSVVVYDGDMCIGGGVIA